MDAYDIFKKLTKGLTFKKRVLGVNNNDQDKVKPVPIKTEEKHTSKIVEPPEDNEDVLSIKSELESENESVEARSDNDGNEKSDNDLEFVEGVKVGEKKKKKEKKQKTEDLQKKLQLEEENRFRNLHGIKVVGRHVPAALESFTDLRQRYGVSQALIDTMTQCGYTEPTPVQRQAIPCMLEDRQIYACAPTGSGKTAAFLVPVLHALGGAGGGPRALVLCPTRELAHQTHRELLRLAVATNLRCTVLKDVKETRIVEREATFKKSDIVISTPNRLCYLLNHEKTNISLDSVHWLVIDEADKLFEGSAEQASDFRQQLEGAVRACGGRRRRVAMFSATHTPRLAQWCRGNLRGLLNVTVGHRNAATNLVEQELLYCGNENGKLVAFRQLVQKGLKPPVLVFVQSKDRAKQLFKELIYDGINVDVIHADRTQQQRDNVVRSFRVGRIWVLICTELLGRGIDFRGVNLVVNYDFPPSAIAYIHRVGRAGRAGQRGRAITFFTQDDVVNLRSIASVMKQSGCEVPEYTLRLRQDPNKRKRLTKKAPRRDQISTILQKRPDKRKLEEGKESEKPEGATATAKVENGKHKKQRRKHHAKENPFSAKIDTGKVVKKKKKKKLGKKTVKPSKS